MIDIISSVQQFAPTLYSADNSRYLESQRYMLKTIDESNLAAQNAATQLASAIGALDFNESERWYKDKLLNDYDAMINGALDKYSGNLRLAMNDIAAKSRELSTSPDVLGRVQTNEQYKEWKQGIEKRQDISQDVKDYIIATNPYHFELQTAEVKDENGNPVLDEKGNAVTKVIGYKDFEGKEPVSQYTDMDINKQILSVLNPDINSGNTITLYGKDENGNYVPTDFGNAEYYINSKGQTEKLTTEKINEAIKLAISDPNIDASLRQDYDVTVNKYKDDTQGFILGGEDYSVRNGKIVDKQGKEITYKEYEFLRFKDIAKTYGYTKYITNTDLHSLVTKSSTGGGDDTSGRIFPIVARPTQAGVVETSTVDPSFGVYVQQKDGIDYVREANNAADETEKLLEELE